MPFMGDRETDPALRAALLSFAEDYFAAVEAQVPWYRRLWDMLLAVLALGGVAYGAVWILVEPWSTRVFQGAFWLALLALLHGLRLLSALRRALPVILLMGLIFLFGQVAVQERFQEPFVFWPIALSVLVVISEHDLTRWATEKWRARQARRQEKTPPPDAP